MIGYWFGRTRAVPLGRDEALPFLPWVFALMAFVAAMAGIGLIVLDDTLRAAERSLAARLTVQVPVEASHARLQTILAVLRQTPGVQSVHLLTAEETARLLEPWLGSPVPIDELPVPHMIDVGLDPSRTVDLATLREQLASVVPDTRIDDHRAWVEDRRAGARPLWGILAAAVAVPLLMIAVATIFAARAAVSARESLLELLHLLGASDCDIARPFAIRALLHGLLGGAISAVAVLATLAVLGNLGDLLPLRQPIAPIGLADWRLWAVLVGVILVAGLIAALSAPAVVLRRLTRLP
jgi:cell division transport system permease protein